MRMSSTFNLHALWNMGHREDIILIKIDDLDLNVSRVVDYGKAGLPKCQENKKKRWTDPR